MLRRVALAASLLVLFTVNTAAAANASVTIKDFQFVNGSPTIGLGDSVTWNYGVAAGNGSHHTSSSVLTPSTWGAMAWNYVFSSPNNSFSPSQTFHEAGSWDYHCLVHASMHGTVSVKLTSSAKSGKLGTTFVITLGNQSLPSGFTHDVQKKRNSGSFATWKSFSTTTGSFKPSKKGTYQLRTRVTHTAAPVQSSGWSPIITIVVS